MADTKLVDLTADTNPTVDDLIYTVNDPTGAINDKKVTIGALLAICGYPCQGRLTTESGVPVSTTDRTAQSTIYFTPYNGNSVALYTASGWRLYKFTEISLALSGLTTAKNYDVFLYDNAGTLTLELSAAWSSDTARTDAIAQQDGIDVKSGSTNKRLVGTIRTTGTTTTEDSAAKRFIWSRYQQSVRPIRVIDTTDSWSYTTNTIRQANASAANQFSYVTGDASTMVDVRLTISMDSKNNSAASGRVGLGIDSTTVFNGTTTTLFFNQTASVVRFIAGAEYSGQPGLGYHYISWNEAGADSTCTFYGDSGGIIQSGMTGLIVG